MEQWALLRIWHVEIMDVVLGSPTGHRFLRTSYLSAPSTWRTMTTADLAMRIETVLVASYELRAYHLQLPDWSPMVPLGFWFEWVSEGDVVADPDATSAPFLFPRTYGDAGLTQRVLADLDAAVQQPRCGLAAGGYRTRFETFRVDEQNNWLILDDAQANAMFAERHDRVG